MSKDQEYPFDVPYEDEVIFFEQTVLRQNPRGAEKKAKFCPICNYPIHVRLVSSPCKHYFCYECYQKNTICCGYCGSLNSKIERIGDNSQIWSCDSQCFKTFQNEESLQKHLENHSLLKIQ